MHDPDPFSETPLSRASRLFWPTTLSSKWAWMCLAVFGLMGTGAGIFISWGRDREATAVLTVVAAAGGIALALALIFLVLWKASKQEVLRSQLESLRSGIAAVRSEVKTAASTPRDAPRPVGELEATLLRNKEDVLRADLVLLGDELVAIRRAILAAYNERHFWKAPLKTEVWHVVKTKHIGARGFHGPRSFIGEAYEGVKEAEELRQMHEIDPAVRGMHDDDRAALRNTLERIVEGERALTSYLNDLTSSS